MHQQYGERVEQIGREAIDRVREEMKQLGQKIAECKDQGIDVGDYSMAPGIKKARSLSFKKVIAIGGMLEIIQIAQ